MSFLALVFGFGKPADPVSKEYIDRVIREHDRQLAELQEAVEALRSEGDDDDEDARAR
jgi:hypothetical protein